MIASSPRLDMALDAPARGDAEFARPSRVVDQIRVFHAIGWRKRVQRQFPIEMRVADVAIRCDHRSISRPADSAPRLEPDRCDDDGRHQKQNSTSHQPPARNSAGFQRARRRPTGSRDRLNGESKIGGGLEAARGLFFKAAPHDAIQAGRNLRFDIRRIVFQDGVHHLHRRCSGEGSPAGQHFVNDHAGAENIGARIHHLAAHLFRRHVTHRAQHRARIRHGGLRSEWFRDDRRLRKWLATPARNPESSRGLPASA